MEKLLAYLHAERGRRVQLARALGIAPSAISMWDRVPSDRVGEVSRITGISASDLRPDLANIFTPPEAAP